MNMDAHAQAFDDRVNGQRPKRDVNPRRSIFTRSAYVTFIYVADDKAQANAISGRVLGEVPCFSGEFAIDSEKDAIVVSLGGRPDRDPASDDGPGGHYNLLWGPHVFAAVGYTNIEQVGERFVTQYALAVTAPKAAQPLMDEARELMEQGLAVLRTANSPRSKQVRVTFVNVIFR